VGEKMNENESSHWNMTTKDIILMVVESVAFIAQVVLCFFFYNSLGLVLVVYLGWGILLIAMIIGWQARVAFETKGEAREDESFIKTRKVVSSGIYGIIRHPMYLSFMLISLTLVFLSQYWVNAVLGMIVIGILYIDMYREEKNTLKKFGDEYQQYMQKVPRVNFVIGFKRFLLRRAKSEKQ
jgi:protein-S-isoprenylcysteine O-methyltransferase Ste14